jgi:hypothetical protein
MYDSWMEVHDAIVATDIAQAQEAERLRASLALVKQVAIAFEK